MNLKSLFQPKKYQFVLHNLMEFKKFLLFWFSQPNATFLLEFTFQFLNIYWNPWTKYSLPLVSIYICIVFVCTCNSQPIPCFIFPIYIFKLTGDYLQKKITDYTSVYYQKGVDLHFDLMCEVDVENGSHLIDIVVPIKLLRIFGIS